MGRGELSEMELLLSLPDVCVGTLQNGQKKVVFTGEVVVDEAFVQLGVFSDAIHSGARQSVA